MRNNPNGYEVSRTKAAVFNNRCLFFALSNNIVKYKTQVQSTRIFVYYENKKGTIVKFVVKLEILINQKWIEIERYDTDHGYVHKYIRVTSNKKP